MKKQSDNNLTTAQAYHPLELLLLEAVDELPNKPILHL